MHIFDNIEDAIIRLSNHAQDFQFPISNNLKTKGDIVNYSVGQNIFRALGVDNLQQYVLTILHGTIIIKLQLTTAKYP